MGAPSVAIIGTGGTIGGTGSSRVEFHSYQGGSLDAEDLVGELYPEIGELAELTATEFRGMRPPGLRLADYHELSRRVDAALLEADAVVITTGTQLLEELAYWLDLTVRSPKPVVVTGSMRPWSVLGSDAPVNLYNAVLLAASGATTGFGAVVLLNDEVFAAREVTKTSTLRVHAFRSRQLGALGTVDGDHIRLLRAPPRVARADGPDWATPFDVAKLDPARLPRVEIAYSYADASGSTVSGLVEAGADGVVVAGEPSQGQLAAVREGLRQGVVFVAGSRTGTGAVYRSGMTGVLAAEDLLPQKARLLLLLALGAAGDTAQARRWFERYCCPSAAVV
jgi:L-asparaginase